jgi:fumarylacetoacetase
VGDYTDFYASVHHATNVGRMLRPDTPLVPNYKHLPIGYHGRASSIVVSGTGVHRPWGQTKAEAEAAPVFAPSRRLDYELELGYFVGPGNRLGERIAIEDAPRHLFGVCLVNDWSARDIQGWEYQPLGPFLGKSFATSVSPWVVTFEALAPFRCPGAERAEGDPAPLPYLQHDEDRALGGLDIELTVGLATPRMRAEGTEHARLSRSNARVLYWTPAQMVAHHTSNGCNLRPGDLMASGTVSGPEGESRGCLLELSWRGTQPVRLPDGEARSFLEDGDEVVFRGRCSRQGFVPIGLGECRGTVLPAVPPSSRR